MSGESIESLLINNTDLITGNGHDQNCLGKSRFLSYYNTSALRSADMNSNNGTEMRSRQSATCITGNSRRKNVKMNQNK